MLPPLHLSIVTGTRGERVRPSDENNVRHIRCKIYRGIPKSSPGRLSRVLFDATERPNKTRTESSGTPPSGCNRSVPRAWRERKSSPSELRCRISFSGKSAGRWDRSPAGWSLTKMPRCLGTVLSKVRGGVRYSLTPETVLQLGITVAASKTGQTIRPSQITGVTLLAINHLHLAQRFDQPGNPGTKRRHALSELIQRSNWLNVQSNAHPSFQNSRTKYPLDHTTGGLVGNHPGCNKESPLKTQVTETVVAASKFGLLPQMIRRVSGRPLSRSTLSRGRDTTERTTGSFWWSEGKERYIAVYG